MDLNMVPDPFWKQRNPYIRKSDVFRMNLFPNLPEEAILIDTIPGLAKGKKNDIGDALLETVEGFDVNEDQREDLLNLVSVNEDVFMKASVELHDDSPLIEKPRACFRRDNEKTDSKVC